MGIPAPSADALAAGTTNWPALVRRMLATVLLVLQGYICGAYARNHGGVKDWQTVQPALQAVLGSLWVPDPLRANAGPTAAARALRQALWRPDTQPGALLPPLFALGEAAARAEHVEVVVESLRLVEDVSNLLAFGGHVPADQVTQLHRRLAGIYTQQLIPLLHSGLVSLAERSRGRAKAIVASLGERSSVALSLAHGRSMRRAAVGPSAVLLSSSHWATIVITLVRGLHQSPYGSDAWLRIRNNLKTKCPSSEVAQDDAQWRRLHGAEVVRWRTLGRIVEDCLSDANSVSTMVRVEGGDVDASNIAGWSPLHHAALLTSGQLAGALLASGATPLPRTTRLGYSPLHIAASRGASDVVKVLLSHEPSMVFATDLKNRTAIDIVCLHDSGVLESAAAERVGEQKRRSWLWEVYRLLQDAGAGPCVSSNGTVTGVGVHDEVHTSARSERRSNVS